MYGPARSLLTAFLAALFALAACGPGREDAPAALPLQTSIDAYLQPFLESGNFSGSILVAQGDEILAEAGYGLAQIDAGAPVSPDTKFQIGSLSKTFTAAAILLLRDRGLVRLDDPVSRYLANLPNGDEISVHDLLVHTSGLARYVFLPDYRERSQEPQTASTLVDWIAEQPLAFRPGERSAYSNANYALLARIIEVVSGSTFEEFLVTQVLEPLSLDATGHRETGRPPIDSMAQGYSLVGIADREPAVAFDYTSTTGSGSLYSTVRDLQRWHGALRDRRLLGPEATSLMFQPHVDGRGYGWMIGSRLGRPALTMSGWDGVGFSAEFLHFPEEALTVIVLCNLNVSSLPAEVATNAAAIALGDEPEPLELLSGGNPAAARAAAGVYRFGPDFYVPNTTLSLAESDGQLVVQGPDGAPAGSLLALHDGSFLHRQHWFKVRFTQDADGTVTAMQYSSFEAQKAP